MMFILEPLTWLVLWVAACWGMGFRILTVITGKGAQWNSGFFLPFAFGTAAFIVIIFLLLSLGLLSKAMLLLFMSLGLFAMILTMKAHPPRVSWVEWLLFGLLLAVFLPAFLKVYRPEMMADALSYHLPYARFLVENQSLVVNEYLRYPLNALNVDLLYVAAYYLQGEVLAKMMHGVAAMAIAIGLTEWGVRLNKPITGLFASWVFLSSTIVTNLLSTAYIDLGLAMFVFASLFPLLLSPQPSKERAWLVSAVMLGTAMGSKYLGLFYWPLLILWVAVSTKSFQITWRYALLSLAIASPWYFYNVWVSGNPIHPFLQNIFGYWLWVPEDVVNQKQDLLVRHGVDRTWLNFFKLPQLLAEDSFKKHGVVSWAFIVGVVAVPVLAFFKQHRLMAFWVLLNLVFWFFTSQILRYLLPVFPLLAIASAVVLTAPLVWLKQIHWFGGKKSLYLIGSLVVLVGLVHGYEGNRKSLKVIAVNEEEWNTLLNKKADYQLVHAANLNQAKGTLKLGFMYVNHYANHPIKGDWYGTVNMAQIARDQSGMASLIPLMARENLDHLLIDFSIPLFKRYDALVQNSNLFDLQFENSKGRLYRLKKPHP